MSGAGHLREVPRDKTLTPNNTDQGNAMRLVARHGEDLHYVYPWGKWLVWDGRRWKADDSGEVVRRAKETIRAMFHEAGSDASLNKELAKHAMKSEARTRIEAMVELTKSEPGVAVRPEQLDADPWLLNAANGTIQLRTDELREHRRGDLITKLVPREYAPNAPTPTFDAFIEKILPAPELRRFVQAMFGYAAIGVNTEQVLPILHGGGANGKSTLVNIVMEALGDYSMQAAPDLLMSKQRSHPTELADLFGARFVAAMENDEGRRLNEGLVKQLTGGDRIKARRMREDFWEFTPTHTPVLATNHKPEVRGTDHAIWRRLKLVPFGVQIPEKEQDKELPGKLREELPGVLAWIVRGALAYQRHGLAEPNQVKVATASYRTEMDVLADFFDARCVIAENAHAAATPLYDAYSEWRERSGEAEESQRRFGMRLKERGFENFTYTSGPHRDRKGWRGIGLRDRHPDDGEHLSGSSALADDQTPPKNSNKVQSAVNNPVSADNSLQSGRSADHRPHAKPRIGKPKDTDNVTGADDSGPKNGMDGHFAVREAIMSKQGPHHPHRPLCDTEASENFAPNASGKSQQQGSEDKGGCEVATNGTKPALAAGGSAPNSRRSGNDAVGLGREELADKAREAEARMREDFCKHGTPSGYPCDDCDIDERFG